MQDEHIDPEEFLLVMDEYADRHWREAFRTHLHFVRGCPECATRILRAFELKSLDELALHHDPCSMLLRRNIQIKGAAVVAWLESLPPEDRLAAIERDQNLKTQIVLHGLLRRARELWSQAPGKALVLTELALAVAPKLIESKEDLDEQWELPALVWAYHGNVLRILSDLREADRAFRKAATILARHPCDHQIIAEVHGLKASLRRDQRRYDEAQAAIDKAIRLYGDRGQWHLQGHHLLTSAYIRCEAGDHEAALADLHRAEPLLDTNENPRLQWVAAGIHLYLLCETSRFAEASAYAPHARKLAAEYGGAADLLRVRWCEGRIAATLGPQEQAETDFREVREGFIELGIGYDAALVSLDLAVLYAEQGRTAEIRELAQQMLALFESRGVGTEALAAAFLFSKATLQETATAQALADVREWLKANRRA